MRSMKARAFACAVLLVLAAGCGSDETAPENAPDDHTVFKDGVAHATGLNEPEAKCVTCHGDDLGGGDEGEPSCFSCHGKKW